MRPDPISGQRVAWRDVSTLQDRGAPTNRAPDSGAPLFFCGTNIAL